MDNLEKRDVFFFKDRYIEEMYYNPDSGAGGSIVENHISFAQFLEAAQNGYDEDTWATLEGDCTQYIHDIDHESFPYYLDIFQKKESACGATEETFLLILEYIHSKLCIPKFLMIPNGKGEIWEYNYNKETGTAIRYTHRLTDIAANMFCESSDQFFGRLQVARKCEKTRIGESGFEDLILESDDFVQKGHTKETMQALKILAERELSKGTKCQLDSLYDIVTRMDQVVERARLDIAHLKDIHNTLSEGSKGCSYCTPSETGYCTEVFTEPETNTEIQLCVGDGLVGINVKFADGREGWLTTAARYCPYCGKKIR